MKYIATPWNIFHSPRDIFMYFIISCPYFILQCVIFNVCVWKMTTLCMTISADAILLCLCPLKCMEHRLRQWWERVDRARSLKVSEGSCLQLGTTPSSDIGTLPWHLSLPSLPRHLPPFLVFLPSFLSSTLFFFFFFFALVIYLFYKFSFPSSSTCEWDDEGRCLYMKPTFQP